jgi:hypothetical protein
MGVTIMKKYTLGEIDINVQNEEQPNWDYYITRVDVDEKIRSITDLEHLIDHIEDPERFELKQTGSKIEVYSRQPDAMIALARILNKQNGIDITEDEAEHLRETLIALQT